MSSYYTLNRPGVVSRGRTQSPAPQRNYISSLPSYNYQLIHQSSTRYPSNHRLSPTPKISGYDQNKLPNATPSRSTSVSNRYPSNSSKLLSPDLHIRHAVNGKISADANSLKPIKCLKNEIDRNENIIFPDTKSFKTSYINQCLSIKSPNISTSTASVTSTSSSSSQSIKNNYDTIFSNINSKYNSARNDKNDKLNETILLGQRGNVGLRNLGNTVIECLNINSKIKFYYFIIKSVL